MDSDFYSRKNFCIKIDFEKNSENPKRIFDSMSHLISSVEYLHRSLLNSVAPDIKSKFLLFDVKEGSIESWFSNEISGSQSTLNEGKVLFFLNRCTELIIDFIKGKESIESFEDLKQLELDIGYVAETVDVSEFPNVYHLDKYRLLKGLSEIGKATNLLNDVDQVYVGSKGNENNVNKRFFISDEQVQALLVERVESGLSDEVLIIKKPDLLGKSMWDFVRGKTTISAKLRDEVWLNDFHKRVEVIAPGDGLYCELKTFVYYDRKGDVIDMKFEVLKVHKNIGPSFEQMEFDGE